MNLWPRGNEPLIGTKRKSVRHTVLLACSRDCRCWCKFCRIETPSSSVSSIVLLLSLILSVDWFNLSVVISSLPLWSLDTFCITHQCQWECTPNGIIYIISMSMTILKIKKVCVYILIGRVKPIGGNNFHGNRNVKL